MNQAKIYHGGSFQKGSSFFASSVSILSTKITITHTEFQGAFLTKTNTLFDLPAGAVVLFTRLKPSVIWAGGAITNYYLSIGITGGTQDLMTEYDANIAVSDTEYAEAFAAQSFDFNNITALKVTARSVGANLSDSVSGTATVEIYYLQKV